MLRYLLDTNIVIYVLKQRPVEVLSTFNANASRMAMSSMTLAELLHCAEKSSRVSENLAAIEDFCSRLQVLPYGPKAAQKTVTATVVAGEDSDLLAGELDVHGEDHAEPHGEGSARWKLIAGGALALLGSGLMLHVLPKGIQRIRHYGVLANGCKKTQLAQARAALQQPPPSPLALESAQAFMQRVAAKAVHTCPQCRGPLQVVASRPGARHLPAPGCECECAHTPAARGPPP